jgi:hypothetical protein
LEHSKPARFAKKPCLASLTIGINSWPLLEISEDDLDLLKSSAEVLGDFSCQHVRVWQLGGVFWRLVLQLNQDKPALVLSSSKSLGIVSGRCCKNVGETTYKIS